jgi:CRISPR-associated protein Cas1
VANSCLYGVCHAAIVSIGLSPALGFFHHGNQRSFVWDVADLYKVQLTLPIAFATVAASSDNVATRVRRACRDAFFAERILERIVPDVYALFALPLPTVRYIDLQRDHDAWPHHGD